MTRKEKIDKEANSFANTIYKEELEKAEAWVAFRVGAEWADKTMIDKACEWLESVNLDYYQIREGVFSTDLVKDFRKAMEE